MTNPPRAETGHASVQEHGTHEQRLEWESVLRMVSHKGDASWQLSYDRRHGIIWRIEIPFPGSAGVPWVTQTFPVPKTIAEEIIRWLVGKLKLESQAEQDDTP